MHTCPLMRCTSTSRPRRKTRSHKHWHAADAIATTLAAWLGYRALSDLLDLLDALPDSNDR
ncbi:MAG: hypothetical protein CPDRYMAC_5256 [uncultured Paraburkholderia sp.]|nr:MAG: hypothetical protein CPDRYDRY_5166 [uncultured Paraburkholderia sp.]CAH2940251.1 MAG: hypothetical protein CPDRYMAC_5256 [uncultured Paraburkholderia sp.]